MNLTYQRIMYREDGIFSVCTRDDTGEHIMVVVEHAYRQKDGSWNAKVKPGIYKCVRGIHHLGPKLTPIETFEITGVIGHSGILFHPGNWNEDTEGCSCVGEAFSMGRDPHAGYKLVEMVTNSRITFKKFMSLQKGLDEFTLTVKE